MKARGRKGTRKACQQKAGNRFQDKVDGPGMIPTSANQIDVAGPACIAVDSYPHRTALGLMTAELRPSIQYAASARVPMEPDGIVACTY